MRAGILGGTSGSTHHKVSIPLSSSGIQNSHITTYHHHSTHIFSACAANYSPYTKVFFFKYSFFLLLTEIPRGRDV